MKQERLDSMLMIFVEQNLTTSINYDGANRGVKNIKTKYQIEL